MAVLSTLPDMEALVGGWLSEHPDIVALDVRVASKAPDSMTRAWIRVTLLAAEDVGGSEIEHLIDYTLQLDCYAGSDAMSAHVGRTRASLLARTARAVLKDREGLQDDGVVVTRVRFPGVARLPDTAFEPAMERYVITMDLLAHAVPTEP